MEAIRMETANFLTGQIPLRQDCQTEVSPCQDGVCFIELVKRAGSAIVL